jgi:hypothetical protein
MKTFEITTPNGNPIRIRSAKRVYTHAVLATAQRPGATSYIVVGWASSLALAEKLLRSTQRSCHPRTRALNYNNVTLVNAHEI